MLYTADNYLVLPLVPSLIPKLGPRSSGCLPARVGVSVAQGRSSKDPEARPILPGILFLPAPIPSPTIGTKGRRPKTMSITGLA